MPAPTTKQDNLQSRLPDPSQFVPELAVRWGSPSRLRL